MEEVQLLLEALDVSSEQSLDVGLSELLAKVEAELGLALLVVAVSVLLKKNLVLSHEGNSLIEVRVGEGSSNDVSESLEVAGASDSGSRSGGGSTLASGSARVDVLKSVELSNIVVGVEGVSNSPIVPSLSSLDSEGLVEEVVDGSLPGGAVGTLVEAAVSDVLDLSVDVVDEGAGDVGVSDGLDLGGSESLDGVVNSDGAGLVGESVGVSPDGRVGVVVGGEVAVVDVMSDVELDHIPPGEEGIGGLGDEGDVERGLVELVSVDLALSVASEALGLILDSGEMEDEGIVVSETVIRSKVVEHLFELNIANSGDVLVESSVSEVLNTEIRDELPDLGKEVSVGLVSGEILRNSSEEDSGSGSRGVEADSLVSSLEHGSEGLEEELVLVLVESSGVDSVLRGEESVDSEGRILAGGSVELLSVDEVGLGGDSSSATLEEVDGGGSDVVVVSGGLAHVLSVTLDVLEEGGEELGGGELAELVGVVVADGVGLVVEESILEVAEDLLVIIEVGIVLLGVLGSVNQVENSVLATLGGLGEDGSGEEDNKDGKSGSHIS